MRCPPFVFAFVSMLGCNQAKDRAHEAKISDLLDRVSRLEHQAPRARPVATLEAETALRLLRAAPSVTVAHCAWRRAALYRRTATEWSVGISAVGPKCLVALAAAGLVSAGRCLKSSYGGACDEQEVSSIGDTSFGDDGIDFACGKVDDFEIQAITTEGNHAKVTFSRKAVLRRELLDKLRDCPLEQTQEGVAVRERSFHRDDSGRWWIDPP